MPTEGHVCCRAEVNIACLDAEHLRPTRIPEAVLNALGPSTDRERQRRHHPWALNCH